MFCAAVDVRTYISSSYSFVVLSLHVVGLTVGLSLCIFFYFISGLAFWFLCVVVVQSVAGEH